MPMFRLRLPLAARHLCFAGFTGPRFTAAAIASSRWTWRLGGIAVRMFDWNSLTGKPPGCERRTNSSIAMTTILDTERRSASAIVFKRLYSDSSTYALTATVLSSMHLSS